MAGAKIRVCSWNIYNDIWHSVNDKVENKTHAYFRSISRLNFIQEMLLDGRFDIMCLQEVDHITITGLKKQSVNHKMTLVTSQQNFLESRRNNCCIMFRDNFKLVAKKDFNLNNSVSTHLTNYAYENLYHIEDAFIKELRARNSTATMILLELTSRKAFLGICNCHIHWNPSYADVKLFHTYFIVKEFCQFVHTTLVGWYSFIPLLLIGDFNSTPLLKIQGGPENTTLSGVYELITTGNLSKKHPHHPAQLRKNKDFQNYPDLNIDPFKSVFKEVNGSEPMFTNKTSKFSGCIDFIFYKELIPISAESIPRNLGKNEILPNSNFPSDHVILMSEFFLV
ncbi:carbon catabolite repressor protein 4 [Plasmodium gonderi]|uniref:Carbon catabolite repressor protein 4 n=1 Tax=Plasmodium gonderi TaxID=77519 RepID=A0A1Y1JG94_PLAGO|nr:carbon catabolite repressor protein 4 [Plasmodium gonderi]GAW79104.1 carbon catabolite repressor protein 4 [Plasmodium gonderi]